MYWQTGPCPEMLTIFVKIITNTKNNTLANEKCQQGQTSRNCSAPVSV